MDRETQEHYYFMHKEAEEEQAEYLIDKHCKSCKYCAKRLSDDELHCLINDWPERSIYEGIQEESFEYCDKF